MQHGIPAHPIVAGDDVGRDVVASVPNKQA
jgi:hypothetical protein